jgi:hypothetical protein
MNLKTLIVTVAVLAALAAAAFVARRPEAPPSADARINQSLVSDQQVEAAAKLRLGDQGRSVALDRQPDGTWLVTSYHDLPADFQKLSGFIGSLTTARLQRLVTSNPERIARLEFKDTKIELLDASDKPLVSIFLGRHADAGGGRFVRFGEESKAYLANLDAWLDSESRNWASPELLSLKPDDIAKIELPLAEGGPVVLSRATKDEPWSSPAAPAGQRVRSDRISSLLTSLGTLRFTDTSSPDDSSVAAARANLRTVTLTTFDQKTVTVALGRKPEEKKLKPPTPGTDTQSGPGSLGSISDLSKKDSTAAKAGEPAPLAPEFETIPAGPVYAFVAHSDAAAPINTWMQKRAFQITEFTFTGLPQKADELFEPVPAAPAEPPTPVNPPPAAAP